MAISPILTFKPQNAYFDGSRFETFPADIGNIEIEGAITIIAKIKIRKWEDLHEGFQYITGQNNGDNTTPEIFLRIRRKGNEALFEGGSWINPQNYEIGFWINQLKHIDKELCIILIYYNDSKEWVMNINGEINYTSKAVGAVKVKNAIWTIGKHNFTGKERYFKGDIYYVAVFSGAISFKLLTDSDNNGYITDPTKNAEAARNEYYMGHIVLDKATPKPLTFFPQAILAQQIVPDDYRHVQLKINADVNNTTYKFECTDNLEIAVRETDPQGKINYNLVPPNTILDINKEYFARAKNADAAKKENNLDKVSLIMYDSNNTKIASETVTFDAQQTLNDWIVPSGWKITTGVVSITTPTPVTNDTVGPQTKGSGRVGTKYDILPGTQSITNPQGDTVSISTYPLGFKLSLLFAFNGISHTANWPEGYIRPDFGEPNSADPKLARDEVYTDPVDPYTNNEPKVDRRGLDFFGNSGVKFCDKEILIFDAASFYTGTGVNAQKIFGDVFRDAAGLQYFTAPADNKVYTPPIRVL
jgi:hypothetical protein